MDIRVFQTFIEVAENRHFGKAAERLFITQAAVSARIKQLEDFYSTQLLIREKNNLKLTPAGEALLSHSYQMVEQLAKSKVALTAASNQKDNVKLAATANMWEVCLAPRLVKLAQLAPGVVISSEISVREVIQRKLAEKVIDLAFLSDPIRDDNLVNDVVSQFELALVKVEGELDSVETGYVFIDWGINFQKEFTSHYKFSPVFSSPTSELALTFLTANGGFAHLPKASLAQLSDKRVEVISSPVQVKRPVYMVYRKGLAKSAIIEQVKHLYQMK